MAHDSLVRLRGLVADRSEAEDGPDALDDGGLAGAAAADQHVEVGVEPNARSVEEAALPGNGNELRVFLGLQLSHFRVEPNSRSGVEERLPEALDAHLGHLDPARRGAVLEVGRLDHVLRIDDGQRKPLFGRMGTAVVWVRVLDDGPGLLGQVLDWPRDLDREEIVALPGAHSSLSLKHGEQPLVTGHVSGDGHTALVADRCKQVREGLVAQGAR